MFTHPSARRTAHRINDAHDWHIFGFGANDNPYFETAGVNRPAQTSGGCEKHPLPTHGSASAGGDPERGR